MHDGKNLALSLLTVLEILSVVIFNVEISVEKSVIPSGIDNVELFSKYLVEINSTLSFVLFKSIPDSYVKFGVSIFIVSNFEHLLNELIYILSTFFVIVKSEKAQPKKASRPIVLTLSPFEYYLI